MGGDWRAARQKDVQAITQSTHTGVLCFHCTIAGLAQKPWTSPRKGVLPCILSVTPRGSSFPKVIAANVLHNIIYYLLGMSVESTFHKIMKLFPRTKITSYLTLRFIPH